MNRNLERRVDELERLLADRRPVRGIHVLVPCQAGGYVTGQGEHFADLDAFAARHPGAHYIACAVKDCRRPEPENINPGPAGQD